MKHKYVVMKIIFIIFSVFFIIPSCSKKRVNKSEILNPKLNLIVNTKWNYNGIKSYSIKDTTTYFGSIFTLNNDSLIVKPVNSKTGELIDTTIFWSFDISDTGFVIKTKHHEIPDSIITQTGLYELFWFNNQNILKVNDLYFTTADENANLQLPDSLYEEIIEFEIGGYKIGDFIRRDLVVITDVYNWYSPPREEGHLKNDENIKLTIIGDSIIVSIEREEIPNSDIDDIIKVISEKTGIDPKYSPPDTMKSTNLDYVSESYDWGGSSKEYDISLRRYKGILNEKSTEIDKLTMLSIGVGWSDWDLEIESSYLKEIINAVYFSDYDGHRTKSRYIK